jgi:hypothetical protein
MTALPIHGHVEPALAWAGTLDLGELQPHVCEPLGTAKVYWNVEWNQRWLC